MKRAVVAFLVVGVFGLASAWHVPIAADRAGQAGPARQGRTGSPLGAGLTSSNWSGYVGLASAFTGVQGSWVQRQVSCPAANAWAVFWVGLDGWNSNTVEQGGSSARCIKGVPRYAAWWEMYPTNAITDVFPIHAGDQMSAGVRYSAGVFTITVRDLTSGRSFATRQRCGTGLTCGRVSAEWVAESPSHFGTKALFPLADWGSMMLARSRATAAGHSGSISDPNWSHYSITQVDNGVTKATPSALNGAGTAFSDLWQHP